MYAYCRSCGFDCQQRVLERHKTLKIFCTYICMFNILTYEYGNIYINEIKITKPKNQNFQFNIFN